MRRAERHQGALGTHSTDTARGFHPLPAELSTSPSPTASNQRKSAYADILAVTRDRSDQCTNPAQYSWKIHFSSLGSLADSAVHSNLAITRHFPFPSSRSFGQPHALPVCSGCDPMRVSSSPIAFPAESGDLYDGTTGDGHAITPSGGGTIYKLSPSDGRWTITGLHDFPNGGPPASLVMDKAGNLYGMTELGGSHRYGSVFKLVRTGNGWAFTSVHDLRACQTSLTNVRRNCETLTGVSQRKSDLCPRLRSCSRGAEELATRILRESTGRAKRPRRAR
jgi:hypothetical protein